MNIKLLYDKVLVEPIEEKNDSDILIPFSIKEKQVTKGKVIKLGKGIFDPVTKTWQKFEFKVGDIVYFKNSAIDYIIFKKKKYILLSASEILGYEI